MADATTTLAPTSAPTRGERGPWRAPLVRVEATPARYRRGLQALLTPVSDQSLAMLRAEAGDDEEILDASDLAAIDRDLPGMASDLPEAADGADASEIDDDDDALAASGGISLIEGYIEIYTLPQKGVALGVHAALDVADDYRSGDFHAATFLDRASEGIVATVSMRGPRHAFVLAVLSVARYFAVPLTIEGLRLLGATPTERAINEKNAALRPGADPDEWNGVALGVEAVRDAAMRRFAACEAWIVDAAAAQAERGEKPAWRREHIVYPRIVWENNVGDLIALPFFRTYPNLYRDRRPDTKDARRSRKWGWNTGASRIEVIRALEGFSLRLIGEPHLMPSAGHHGEARRFAKNNKTRRYEAESGAKDDLIMSLGIALVTGRRYEKARRVGISSTPGAGGYTTEIGGTPITANGRVVPKPQPPPDPDATGSIRQHLRSNSGRTRRFLKQITGR